MRMMVLTLGLMLPLAVHAAPASDAMLDASFKECVNRCGPGHARAFCNEICGCMTGEMGRHWEDTDFQTRARALQANPQDEQVMGEMDRLARYCAERIGQ